MYDGIAIQYFKTPIMLIPGTAHLYKMNYYVER